MNMKKITLITIIAITVLLSLSAVSAGWFDFLGSNQKEAGAKIIDASIDITKATVKDSSTGATMATPGESGAKPGYKLNVTIKLDLSDASDDVKNMINDINTGRYAKEDNKHVFTKIAKFNVTTNNDDINKLRFLGHIQSYENDVLVFDVVKFVSAEDYPDITTGEVQINRGDVALYLLSYKDKNVTLHF